MAKRLKSGPVGLRVIGGFKVVCAILFVVAGVGVLKLVNRDVGDTLHHAVAVLRLDPENRYIDEAVSKASGISAGKLQALGLITFGYAALYLVEGVGLILQRRWAGYLTVIATASLVPLEGYEIYRKPTPLKVAVLVVNLAMVAYVAWKLRQEIREERAGGSDLTAKSTPRDAP